MTDELKLPPYIENRNGSYFNTLNQRWIGGYKIEKICRDYWENEGASPVVQTGNGTIVYKKNFVKPKKEHKKRGFKSQTDITDPSDVYEPIIIHEKIDAPDWTEEKEDVLITPNSGELESEVPAQNEVQEDQFPENGEEIEEELPAVETEEQFTAPVAESATTDIDISTLMTIASAAKALNHTGAYIYQLINKGSLDEVIVDGKKFVTMDSVEHRKQEYIDQDRKLNAENASQLSRSKKIIQIDPAEIIEPFIEKIERDITGKSDAEKFFESPMYENSVSFLWNIESHEGLVVILSGVCSKEFGIEWDYMLEKVRVETVPKYIDVWYEEIMAMICHALWIKLPVANRIDWLSGFLNRTPNQVKALLGIYYREMYTSRGKWYDHKTNNSSWWEHSDSLIILLMIISCLFTDLITLTNTEQNKNGNKPGDTAGHGRGSL